MPRSDDVPAKSQPMMFVLAPEDETPRQELIRRSIRDKGDGLLNAHVFHVYLTSINVIVSWGPQ